MSKLSLVLRCVHHSEARLGRELLAVADRHVCDPEIRDVAHDLARWPRLHVRRLARLGRAHGVRLSDDPRYARPLAPRLSRTLSTAMVHRPEPALLLLADLRRLHRKAAVASVDWELLAQSAQALRADDLLELTEACHPRTLRVLRWSNAQLKVLAPQTVAA